MFGKISVFVFVLLCATIGHTNGQEACVPGPVQYLTMYINGTLSWIPTPGEPCTISEYIITLQLAFNSEIDHSFETVEQRIDLSHLPSCSFWIFNVVAVSGTEVGANNFFRGRVPLFSDADLNITINAVLPLNDGVFLQWEMVNSTFRDCVDTYRITSIEENDQLPVDRTTTNTSIILRNIAFCGRYGFSVRAIHISAPYTEGPLASDVFDAPLQKVDPPRLTNLVRGSTFINTTWTLQENSRNFCSPTAVFVDGAPYFNATFEIDERPGTPVEVSLTNLVPNSYYNFRVYVENVAGLSDPIPLGVQTLPAQPGK